MSKHISLTENNTIDTEASMKYFQTEESTNQNYKQLISNSPQKSTISFNLYERNKLKPLQNKKNTIRLSMKEKRKKIFNKIYGLDDDYYNSLINLKKNKNLSLIEHQNKIIQLSSNLGKQNLQKLNKELRNIRIDSSLVCPLPPLNYRALVEHSHNENKKNKLKNRISLSKSLRIGQIKDKYEMELEKEKFKYYKPKMENANIQRMYEILPEHIVEVFVKKKHSIKSID